MEIQSVCILVFFPITKKLLREPDISFFADMPFDHWFSFRMFPKPYGHKPAKKAYAGQLSR
jgi:hypothetical protein